MSDYGLAIFAYHIMCASVNNGGISEASFLWDNNKFDKYLAEYGHIMRILIFTIRMKTGVLTYLVIIKQARVDLEIRNVSTKYFTSN